MILLNIASIGHNKIFTHIIVRNPIDYFKYHHCESNSFLYYFFTFLLLLFLSSSIIVITCILIYFQSFSLQNKKNSILTSSAKVLPSKMDWFLARAGLKLLFPKEIKPRSLIIQLSWHITVKHVCFVNSL